MVEESHSPANAFNPGWAEKFLGGVFDVPGDDLMNWPLAPLSELREKRS